MNWPVLWSKLKALEGKVDSLETISFEPVTELPETGEPNIIYLVPKSDPETGNYSDEYIWDSENETYEKIGDTQIAPIEDYIKNSSIAPLYDNTSTYAVGDIVAYEKELYRCTTAISTAEEWNSAHWTKTDIISEMPVIPENGLTKTITLSPGSNATTYNIDNNLTQDDLYNLILDNNFNAVILANASSTTKLIYTPIRLYNNSYIEAILIKENTNSILTIWELRINKNSNLKTLQYQTTTMSIPDISGRFLTNSAADGYVTSKTYNTNDIVSRSDKLYKCKQDNVTGSWNSSKWDEVTVMDIIGSSIPTDYTKDTAVTALYDNTATYELGDIVMYNKELYECTTAISVAEEWDSTHWTKTDIISEMPNQTTVSVNDIQKSGTKIAEITVNGVQKDIYAPYFAEDFYGFIEHKDILDPTQRIEYIGINRNYTTPYTPNLTDGSYNLGSWTGWAWLDKVKPYMVNSDGTKDYALSETDYNYKADGETPSDIANTSYNGGAFVWIPKIWKQEYMVGHDRYVKFSLTEKADYEPVGFVYGSDELEGLWIPMFYGSISDSKMMSLSGLQPDYSKTTAQQYTAITAFSNRAGFYGGPIVNTINDILIMLAKTTDLQLAYGFGNMSGYDASDTYNGVLPNAVVSGGMFYGTNNSKQLNKIFHSIVLGSYQQWQRDPYTLLVSGRYKVSKNYTYDLTGATYFDTGIDLARIDKQDESQNTGPFYPHLTSVIPGFGDVPVQPCNGSTALGLCDVMYQDVTSTRVGLRFGRCNDGRAGGPRALLLANVASHAAWAIGSSVLLFPPVGVAV